MKAVVKQFAEWLMHERTKLASILHPERNSFTLVRLVAASAVIVSHAFEISVARNAPQPLSGVTPFNLGQHAVNAFFVLSGLTLAQSLAIKPGLARFVLARLLRIVPALIVYGIVLSFLAGPLLTSRSFAEYFSSIETYLYPLDAVVRFADASPPPGIFENVPVSGVVNEPLWTIRYEVLAYIGLATLAAAGLFPNPIGITIATLGAIAAFGATEAFPDIATNAPFVGSLARFGLCFMLGVAAYALRHRLVLSYAFLLAGFVVVWSLNDTSFGPGANLVFVAYLVFVLGGGRYGAIGSWSRKNDISYGTYLYGWPIQQMLVVVSPGMSAAWNIAFALAIAPIAGLFSWRCVERPALALKSSLPSTQLRIGDGDDSGVRPEDA